MKSGSSLPPVTDEQLYAAEQTELRRRNLRLAEQQEAATEEQLAAAGDPEAQAALRASAGVFTSARPLEEGGPGDDTKTSGESQAARPTSVGRKPKAKAPHSAERPSDKASTRPPQREPEELSPVVAAYRLMDAAHHKWAKLAEKDVRKANRELAIDLGKDTALYLRAGLIRLGDIHDVIQKLLAIKAVKEEADESGFEQDLEDLRVSLRGGK